MAERLLIVDDEANMRWVLKEALDASGYEVHTAATGEEALGAMAHTPADLVVLDLKLKGMDGLVTLRRLVERWPDSVVIILTAYGTVATAVEAMQIGAADYLRKPFDVEEIGFKIRRALERKALQAEVRRLRGMLRPAPVDGLVGAAPAWRQCLEQVRSLTALDLDLLVVGEAGSGRTMLVRLAFAISERRDAPLVELDIAVFAPGQHRAILRGHGPAEGAWSKAGAGTLLLRHVDRLGADGLAALVELIEQRGGRGPRLLLTAEAPRPELGDLPLARLRVPALRERLDDLPLLAAAFAPDSELTAPALQLLERHHWPGNVAELRGVIERAAAMAKGGPIQECHLPSSVQSMEAPHVPINLPAEGLNMEEIEVALLRQALDRAGGNKTRAAELLGLTRHTLLYRIEKYGLEP